MFKTRLLAVITVLVSLVVEASAPSGATLPEGYRAFDSFDLDGAQWVDTGYFPKCTDLLSISLAFPSNRMTNVNACFALWCARNGSADLTISAFLGAASASAPANSYRAGSFRFDRQTAAPGGFSNSFFEPGDESHNIIADCATGVCTLDGETIYTFPNLDDFSAGSRLVLFASHKAGLGLNPASTMDGNWASYRFYSFRVYDKAGTLVRDYVPVCKLDESEPLKRYGLYECVTGAFCANNGSRPFIPPLETVVLEEDADLSGLANPTFGKRFDLNGHTLTLDALAGPTAVTNSAEGARGELRLNFTTDATIREFTVGGDVQVVKGGAGNLTLAGGAYGGTWRVAAGTLTVATAFNQIVAKAEAPLVVESGAVFAIADCNNPQDRLPLNAQVVVNGGEMRVGGYFPFNNNPMTNLPSVFVTNGTFTAVHDRSGADVQLQTLTLADSVLRFEGSEPGLGSPYNHGLWVSKLTTTGECRMIKPFDSPNLLYGVGAQGAGSEINVVSGTFRFPSKFKNGDAMMVKTGAGRLQPEEGMELYLEQLWVEEGTVTVNAALTRAVTRRLAVGASTMFDLTESDAVLGGEMLAFEASSTVTAGVATVTLDVHGRTLANGERLVRFATCATNATFILDAATARAGGTLTVAPDGVFYGGPGSRQVYAATWTGAANDGDVTNARNWACVNVAEEPLADVAPTVGTRIGDVTLTRDLDWRALGTLHLAGTVNLNGHRLQTAGISGSGRIIDDTYDLTTTNGTSHITVSNANALNFRNTPVSLLFNDRPFYSAATGANQQRIIVQQQYLPFSIDYDFGVPTVVDSYRMQHCDAYDRHPSAWTFSGSDDGETWTELDSRANETNFSLNCFHQFDFTNATAYRHYRLTLTTVPGNAYAELCQLEYGRRSAAPGELVVEIAAGETNVNASVALDGNFKLTKTGAGTFVAAQNNPTYRGGTEVVAGTFAYGTAAYPAGMGKIAVVAGATLDMNGFADSGVRLDYPLELAGTVRQQFAVTDAANNTSMPSFGNITLTGDATIAGNFYFGRRLSAGVATPGYIAFNGHCLTFEVAKYIGLGDWRPVGSEPGSVRFIGADIATECVVESLYQWDFQSMPFAFESNAVVKIKRSFRVGDFSYQAENWLVQIAGNYINVSGHFIPGALYPPILFCDGSTFDLSGVTGAFDVTGAEQTLEQSGEISFNANATVTIDVHGRTFAPGEQIVKWTRPVPTGVTFAFDETTAAGGIAPFVTDTGIYYGKPAGFVYTATWTGAANDGDIANPLNWTCQDEVGDPVADGVPGEAAAITVAGENVAIQFPTNTTPVYRAVEICDCTLAADCDWRGIDPASITGTINLKGHKLYTTGLEGNWKCIDTSGYDLVEYLDFNTTTAASGQKIHLDLTPLSTDRLEMRFLITEKIASGRYYGLWCARNNNGTATYTCFVMNSGGNSIIRYDYNSLDQFASSTAMSVNQVHTVVVDPAAGKIQLDENWWAMTGASFNVGSALVVGAAHKGGGSFNHYCNCRIYGFKVTDKDGVPKADFVPARRLSDGELGLLNLLTYEFKTNSGTGTLGAGETTLTGQAGVGELHVCVPDDGAAHFNNSVALIGSLKLVLDGPGRFAANRANQFYTGGTVVAGGVATTYHTTASLNPAGNHFWGPQNSRITVEADAEFNTKGWHNYHFVYQIVLAGGRWTSLDGLDMSNANNNFGAMTLTADSEIIANRNICFRNDGIVDLGGHTLTITIEGGKDFYLHKTVTFTNGTVVVRGGRVGSFDGVVHAETVDFRFEDGFFYLPYTVAPLNVGGYYAGEPMEGQYNRGVVAMNVYGRFTPASDDFYGCTLQDGASIDLSGKTGTWSVTSPRAQGMNTVTVANGATVTVELGNRNLHGNLHIIAWDEEPQNVTWQLDEAHRKQGYRLESREDGLYIHRGFYIILR